MQDRTVPTGRGGAARLWAWRRDERGATAVELGFIAPLFVLLFAVWAELGLTLYNQSVLDNAAFDAARMIKTGQVQNGGSEAGFKAQLCDDVKPLIACADLVYKVQSGAAFSALSPAVTVNGAGVMVGGTFAPGDAGDDVLVQVGYTRSIIIPFVASFFGTGGRVRIVSSVAFQNEPF